jgi:hypothetical protein
MDYLGLAQGGFATDAAAGGKFTRIPGLVMKAGLINATMGVPEAACKAACSAEPTCKSFSWALKNKKGGAVNECYTSTVSLTYSEEFDTHLKSKDFKSNKKISKASRDDGTGSELQAACRQDFCAM